MKMNFDLIMPLYSLQFHFYKEVATYEKAQSHFADLRSIKKKQFLGML